MKEVDNNEQSKASLKALSMWWKSKTSRTASKVSLVRRSAGGRSTRILAQVDSPLKHEPPSHEGVGEAEPRWTVTGLRSFKEQNLQLPTAEPEPTPTVHVRASFASPSDVSESLYRG